ncbi:hypothetical protein [Micromonospora sp. WMMD980]|uniref:DUF7239 family protein n=1 Tax=Micromonospora sp. WMMD980 TaxID=3016088 RepID=UPI00241613A3|nr:hypothetical protein [Micromonospora sp. WMMD980]MDG4801704.1 hypothetical protein [Micromonospora sp. WMMD980]
MSLRRRVADAEAERDAARLATDPEASSAVLDQYADIPIGLGRHARVTFKLADLNVTIYRDDWGALQVMGNQPFAVHPSASNTVEIAPRSSE